MDIINTVALAPLAQTTAIAAPTAAAAPDALAAARFAELMAAPPNVTTAANAVQATGTVAPQPAIAPLDANASVGDRILHSIQGVSSDFKNSWETVSKALSTNSTEPMGMQEMLKLQLNLVQTSFQYEMVSKVISRSTQNLDQLVRIQ